MYKNGTTKYEFLFRSRFYIKGMFGSFASNIKYWMGILSLKPEKNPTKGSTLPQFFSIIFFLSMLLSFSVYIHWITANIQCRIYEKNDLLNPKRRLNHRHCYCVMRFPLSSFPVPIRPIRLYEYDLEQRFLAKTVLKYVVQWEFAKMKKGDIMELKCRLSILHAKSWFHLQCGICVKLTNMSPLKYRR